MKEVKHKDEGNDSHYCGGGPAERIVDPKSGHVCKYHPSPGGGGSTAPAATDTEQPAAGGAVATAAADTQSERLLGLIISPLLSLPSKLRSLLLRSPVVPPTSGPISHLWHQI